MIQFFEALSQHAFLQNALIAGVLASIACGVIGTYVVVRRITYIAGGISHCVLGGIGAARYLNEVHGWSWLHPLHGALAAALVSAGIIGAVSLRARQREDTVIGALWAIGMAVGVLFIARTPSFNEDAMSYLFGDILFVSRADLIFTAVLDAVIILTVWLLNARLQAVCFDEEFARMRGLNVEAHYLLLLGLTALTVVVLVKVVGIILVIALLTIPAAIAGMAARTLLQMMLLATLLAAAFTTAGMAASYSPNLPPGAVIVAVAGGAYLLSAILAAALRRAR